jgi:hypothetical protein
MGCRDRLNCEDCQGKLTRTLSPDREKELTNAVIATLKKYPISYVEAYKVLNCVQNKLDVMSDNLQL